MQTSEHAHARTSDPETSHAAAASVGDVRLSQAAVLRMLQVFGPMNDETLVVYYENFWEQWKFPQQSPSGIRSRRAELVRKGLVEHTGVKTVMNSGRLARQWAAVQ